jgi:hypothetical protein
VENPGFSQTKLSEQKCSSAGTAAISPEKQTSASAETAGISSEKQACASAGTAGISGEKQSETGTFFTEIVYLSTCTHSST